MAIALFLLPACGAGGLGADPADADLGPGTPDGGSDTKDGGDLDAGPDADNVTPACGELPNFTTGVSTLGGCGVAGSSDGPRGVATFSNPVNVAAGPDGSVYVADFDSNRVRVVDADGDAHTLVSQVGFSRPFGLAVDGDGTLYVQTDDNDSGQHSIETGTIWRVNLASGGATVVARNLGRPRGMVALPDGRLVISDYQHHDVRVLDPDTAAVTPLAGLRGTSGWVDATGGAARFHMPYGLAVLPDGRVAVADYGNHRVRAVALDGAVTTIVGTGTPGDDDGAALSAKLGHPEDVAVDAAGNLYIADTDNYVVRRLAGGQVTTMVGNGVGGWLDSADLRAAELYGLEGLAVTADGATMWVADGTRGEDAPYNRVRVVALP